MSARPAEVAARTDTSDEVPPTGAARIAKRTIDVVGALVLLVLLSWLILLIALAVRLNSPGPALFRQRRIGRDGQPFEFVKFRTMARDAEAMQAQLRGQSRDPHWLLLDHDPRVTRLGRVLRRTSLDELPQLWLVLRGDMSLVGPRALSEDDFLQVPPWGFRRFAVSPGLTGLWQVEGRTYVSFAEMIRLDCRYVDTWSLRNDLILLMRTVPALLTARGAN
jgi:lipopolysaccharide/colanic/teichoic acid biosynthesis glycosyltransferase